MRRIPIAVCVCLAVAFAATACERASDVTKSAGRSVNDAAKATGKALDSAATATGQALENAAESTGEALEAAGAYVNRHKVVEASRDQLEGLRSRWHELQDKVDDAGKSVDSRFVDLSERMARGLDDTDRMLAEADDAGAAGWQAARSALDSSMVRAQELYEYLVVEFGG